MVLDHLASQAARSGRPPSASGLSRRRFLQAGAAAGGGLMLSLSLPSANSDAEAVGVDGFAPDAFIRIEGDFPAGLEVYDFEFKPGWKIDFKKDANGKIVGAFWIGRIEPYEFVEFGMLAINPKDGNPNMLWKFYQYYEDGFKEEFTAPPDAKMPLRPMPQVTLTPEPSSPKT